MINDYLASLKKRQDRQSGAFAMLLYELVLETAPTKVLEIGVYKSGVSTHVFLQALDQAYKRTGKKCRLTSVDIQDYSQVVAIDDPLREFWTFVHMDSSAYCRAIPFDSLDILYIDGGHEYEQVKADFTNYSSRVKPGGYILIHDVAEDDESPGVTKFWNEIRGQFEDSFRFPWQWGMGILRKPL